MICCLVIEMNKEQTVTNLENELSTRFETCREDKRVLTSIKEVMDKFVGDHTDADIAAIESMKIIETIINNWCRLDNFEGIDYVHIKIDAAEHTTVLITYPAYTIGNQNAMEHAIAGIVSRLRRGS